MSTTGKVIIRSYYFDGGEMKKVEYLIVGQGLAGTMLAFELLEKGIDFRIVSSSDKSKASLVAAGMVNPLVFKRMTKSWMVDDVLPHMLERYRYLEEKLRGKFYFEKEILKPLSAQEHLLWKERKEEESFRPYVGKINDQRPIDFVCEAPAYGIVKNAGYLNLFEFLKSAEKFFLQNELLMVGDFKTGRVEANGNFLVHSTEAEKVIFCDGYHLKNNVLFDRVKMNPAKGEVLLIHAPDLSEEYIINKLVFVLPVGDHHFKVGSTYEWDDLNELPTKKGEASIIERLDKLITAKYTVVNHWAGVRPTIHDRRPVLGKHPDLKNIFVFNGLGTKGVMLASRMAQIMANYLVGQEELPAEISLDRFS